MARNIYRVEFTGPAKTEAEQLGLHVADLEVAVREELDSFNCAHLGPSWEAEMPDNGFHSFVHRDSTWIVLFGCGGRIVTVDAVVATETIEAALPDWIDDGAGQQTFTFPNPATWPKS